MDNPEHPQKKPAASSVQKDDHQRQRALETGDVMGVPKPGQQATVAKSRNSLPGGMHAAVKIPTKSQRSGKVAVAQQAPSSKFRGVTRHRRSGRYGIAELHFLCARTGCLLDVNDHTPRQ